MFWLLLLVIVTVAFLCYVRANDRKLAMLPTTAATFNPGRTTLVDKNNTVHSIAQPEPMALKRFRTGRRYIVIGGAGFLGGCIVTQLLARGEKPSHIRILDIRPPTRHDLASGNGSNIPFFRVDIRDAQVVAEAFRASWPVEARDAPLTIFHTAANIRFYERCLTFLSRSTDVNVKGTQNIIEASRSVGATILIYTSSGSVAVRNTRFLLWPWVEAEPQSFVQLIDDHTPCEKPHNHFFSNYAVSKWNAEKMVRASDLSAGRNKSTLRTGVIRPGNGVYGVGDMLIEAYLARKLNPACNHSIMSSFCFVENCAESHLCYEKRLIELSEGGSNPDIGGQAFTVCDSGPPPTYGDLYNMLNHLDNGRTTFPAFSTTLVLLIAHMIERYYIVHHVLTTTGYYFASVLPAVSGDIVNLQPSMFSLTMVHLIFDDSRARLPANLGGLEYTGPWTTLEGVHRTFMEHTQTVGRSDTRSQMAGANFGFLFRSKTHEKGSTGAVPLLKRVDTAGT